MNQYLLDCGKQLLFPLLFIFFANILCAQVTYEAAFPNLTFDFPIEIQHAGDGTNRLFVVEQTGRIKVFPNSDAVSDADQSIFLDLSQEVRYSAGQEIGLLGLAFHPNYAQNGYFFVYYTRESTVANVAIEMVLARYTASGGNANLADPATRLEILSFDKNQLDSNHNGGKVAFGPDGYLYISIGDGGGAGDPNDNAQNLDNVFGSILRIDIDVDGTNPLETNPDLPNGNYEIPADNPRVGLSGLDEHYAWGIRNTWKFSFDGTTGNLWGADVGQGDFEEINLITNGGNYGWDRFEATTLSDSGTTLATPDDIDPVYFYDHNQGDVSITGGYVYRGSSTDPLLNGKYIYGDYVSGRVWSLDYNDQTGEAVSTLLFRTNGQFVSSFGQDEAGELYFSDYGSGRNLYRILGGTTEQTTVAVAGVGQWENLTNGIDGVVRAVARSENGILYVGGEFTNAGDINANNIAFYEESTGWNSFGTGTNGSIDAIAIGPDDKVYIGGLFTSVDGVAANNIAVWDGTQWSPLGVGTDGLVQVIKINAANALYAGGSFENAGGIAVRNIALWAEDGWSGLTDANTGISGTNNEVRAIAIEDENRIYVGGNFDTAGGISAPRIAIYDNNQWSTPGEGTSGFVQAIYPTEGYVYIGGNFALAGNNTVNRIARWDKATLEWQSLGEGVSGNVNTLEYDGTYIYAGGSFETASNNSNTAMIMQNIARWSVASGWEALGSDIDVGVTTQVNDMVFDANSEGLYVGGNFSTSGAIQANNSAVWFEEQQSTVIVIGDDNFTLSVIDNICPDANDGSITVSANQVADYELSISNDDTDVTYQFTESLEIADLSPNNYEINITASGNFDADSNFNIDINGIEPLTVAAQLNQETNNLSLNLSGANSYFIEVNGVIEETQNNLVSIPLIEGSTTVKVTTDTECQGSFEETFLVEADQEPVDDGPNNQGTTMSAYPNPVGDVFQINVANLNEEDDIRIQVYTIAGALIFREDQFMTNGVITIDAASLSTGVYLLNLQQGNFSETLKLVKE